MNYDSDLPGGKQMTKGDKKLTVIYYMDYSPLSNIRHLMKWVWLIPSQECRPSNYIKYVYTKNNNNNNN